MKYLIWQSGNDDDDDDDDAEDTFLKILSSNRSFAEVFEGDNPLHPVGDIIMMHQRRYKITKFEKMENMARVGVMPVEAEAT